MSLHNDATAASKMNENRDESLPPLKRYKKIPIYVVEEHNEALQFIYSAIGGKKLPIEGTTLVHLDAHPDMLLDRKLKGEDARSGRKLLPLLQIENWILPAVAAGHVGNVIWLRPPWAKQFTDGTRTITVGDHPETGLLRVNSREPYYLSDALYSNSLINTRKFKFTVAELSDTQDCLKLASDLNVTQPYVLDIDLDFFSTGNPFLNLYQNIGLYDRLLPIFNFKLPDEYDAETVDKVVESRERQLNELEHLFQHLEDNNSLETYTGERTQLYEMVSDLAESVRSEADKTNASPDWWAVYAGGCTRDQEGLPHHISSEAEIIKLVDKALVPFLQSLPPPVLITLARSTDDGYCPPDQVEFIQSLVIETLSKMYDTDDPALHYLKVNTC